MTPDEIAAGIVAPWLDELSPATEERITTAIAAALAAERERAEKAEADARDWQSIAELNARTGRELAARAEKAEAERDEALREAPAAPHQINDYPANKGDTHG